MNKLKVAASALGIFTGLGGATHGPGAMLQGSIAPSSIEFKAWPSLTALNGEPAMTIIPNLLVTGILTIVVGALLAVWAAKFISRKHSGLALILLTIALLLVGGGLVPPLFGIAGGIIAGVYNYKTAKNGGDN
ncbi:MAG TPA: hypothetical protein VK253_07105 [Candidatus Binatia bacterium]|nr:hypothetical protein [Candidatus Binatia bacterium]